MHMKTSQNTAFGFALCLSFLLFLGACSTRTSRYQVTADTWGHLAILDTITGITKTWSWDDDSLYIIDFKNQSFAFIDWKPTGDIQPRSPLSLHGQPSPVAPGRNFAPTAQPAKRHRVHPIDNPLLPDHAFRTAPAHLASGTPGQNSPTPAKATNPTAPSCDDLLRPGSLFPLQTQAPPPAHFSESTSITR